MTTKMFIKRKTRTGKVYAYKMLVSFRVLRHLQLTTTFLTSQRLARYCPMSGTDIQVCTYILIILILETSIFRVLL